MILTELPDLPPLPETRYNKAFREAFYKQWGKGNWIVCGWAHRAEYTRFRQTLSFKMVNDGTERYFVDGRRITVTDNTYLVLNEGREYSSILESPRRAFSFSIFVRPGLAGEVAHAAPQSLGAALDTGAQTSHGAGRVLGESARARSSRHARSALYPPLRRGRGARRSLVRGAVPVPGRAPARRGARAAAARRATEPGEAIHAARARAARRLGHRLHAVEHAPQPRAHATSPQRRVSRCITLRTSSSRRTASRR